MQHSLVYQYKIVWLYESTAPGTAINIQDKATPNVHLIVSWMGNS